MKLKNEGAEIYVPQGTIEEALENTTCMGIAAHQDDLEIMTYHGIQECFGNKDKGYFGLVCTNGSGSSRTGIYADYTDEQMMEIRKLEQKKAAFVGEYSGVAMLNYSSSEIKDTANLKFKEELKNVILEVSPTEIYTHNLADKHDTHVSVVIRVIQAIREIPKEKRPKKIYGCEVWRGLDWMMDDEKVIFDVSKRSNIASALVEMFDSQVCGGKRYDLAALGRRLSNATFAESHFSDKSNAYIYAMDLTPLIEDETIDISQYVLGYIDRLYKDIKDKIEKFK